MMIFFGLNFKAISTNLFPNDPVPPVTKIVLFLKNSCKISLFISKISPFYLYLKQFFEMGHLIPPLIIP